MKRFAPLTLFAATILAGCGDQPAVTGPDPIGPGLPSASISDGAHSDGNPDFFFLPPLVKEPTGNPAYKDDPFDGSVASQVRVVICELDPKDPCNLVREFTSADIKVSLSDETYHVNWDTKAQVLNELFHYRIQVFIGDVLLGFADADVVDRGNELKNVETGEYIALLDGRTMPIQFRIEEGALCEFDPCATFVVDNSVGGTFFFPGNIAGIDLPAGALPYPFGVLTIQRKPVLPGTNCVDDGVATGVLIEQWEGCFIFTLTPELVPGDATGFQKDVGVGVCAEPDRPENSAVFKWDEGRPLYMGPPYQLQGLMCDGFTETPTPSTGLIGSLRTGFDLLAGSVARLLGPKSAYAVDGGLGCLILRNSLSNDLSTFFYGQPLTAAADGYPATTPQVTIGEAVPGPIAVKVTTLGIGAHDDDDVVIESHDHAHDAQPVEGVPVKFTVDADGGMLFDGESLSTSIIVNTGEDGIATLDLVDLDWVLGMAEGEYTLTATGPFVEIDGNRDVATASVTFTAQGIGFADLAVTGFDRSPTAPTSVDEITYSITISNLGPSPAPASTGQFVRTLSTGGTTAVDTGVVSVPAIAGNSSETVTHSLGVQTAGSYTAQFTANTGDEVTESDATNNTSAVDAFAVTQAMTDFAGGITDARIATLGLGGATITLRNVSTGQSWQALSDATGAYTFAQSVPVATYTLGVSRVGYAGQSVQIAPTAGPVTQDFALTPIIRVTGVIIDAQGGCHDEFQNLTVSLTGNVGGVAVSEPATTGDKCEFVFTGVSAGTYTVTAPNPTGWTLVTSQVQLTVPGTNVDVDVPFTAQPLNGVVTGVLQNSDGLVYQNVRVDLRSGENVVSTTTNSNGRYGFAGVPPGTYSVDVLSSSGQTVITSGGFNLAAGEKKTVDFTLDTDELPGPVSPVSTTPLPPPTGCTLTCTFSP